MAGYGDTGPGFGEGDVRKRTVRAPSTRVCLPGCGNERRLLLRQSAVCTDSTLLRPLCG